MLINVPVLTAFAIIDTFMQENAGCLKFSDMNLELILGIQRASLSDNLEVEKYRGLNSLLDQVFLLEHKEAEEGIDSGDGDSKCTEQNEYAEDTSANLIFVLTEL